jgi:hypothetical protein
VRERQPHEAGAPWKNKDEEKKSQHSELPFLRRRPNRQFLRRWFGVPLHPDALAVVESLERGLAAVSEMHRDRTCHRINLAYDSQRNQIVQVMLGSDVEAVGLSYGSDKNCFSGGAISHQGMSAVPAPAGTAALTVETAACASVQATPRGCICGAGAGDDAYTYDQRTESSPTEFDFSEAEGDAFISDDANDDDACASAATLTAVAAHEQGCVWRSEACPEPFLLVGAATNAAACRRRSWFAQEPLPVQR